MRRKPKEFFRISQYKRRYDHKTGKFIIDIAYETATQTTPRTIAVSEAFGLGIDQQQKFTLYDNIELKIGLADIVYITGDSGSGKSVLLKAIKNDLGRKAIDITQIKPNPNKPLIDTIGKNLNEGLELLSKAGLNDAFLFVRRFRELSDGQKYRYKIAKLMESRKKWWIADEFCSTLDRDTAKIVAYNIQKIARQMGKTLIVATTHTDLFEDLAPTAHVHKRFGKEIIVRYYPNTPPSECTVAKEMQISEGTTADYKALSVFHYRSNHCPPPRKIYTLKRKDELCGVIVYSYPPPTCFGRKQAKLPKTSLKKLNKKLSTITRVVIHPKYRTIGLGTKLVRETLPLAGTLHVETVAVMAKYNPFFEKAGMQKITETKPNPHVLEAITQLYALGFNPQMLSSQTYNLQKIHTIGKNKIIKILEKLSLKGGASRNRLLTLKGAYPNHQQFVKKLRRLDEENLAKTLKKLSFLAQTKVYLFWSKV
ncbi:MAG: GNAT family N-acetyltransferase [Candidatus Bathyarchaeia archaeon]